MSLVSAWIDLAAEREARCAEMERLLEEARLDGTRLEEELSAWKNGYRRQWERAEAAEAKVAELERERAAMLDVIDAARAQAASVHWTLVALDWLDEEKP